MHTNRLTGFAVLAFALSADAFALGAIGFDSYGFLKKSPYRSDSSTWISLEPSLDGQNSYLAGALNLKASAYVSDFSTSLTIDSGDTYVATSPKLIADQQLSLGRRRYDWSTGDRFWSMGMWQPRFLWDPFRPDNDGLTGFFYSYESPQWKFLAYASALAIPDRSYPIRAQNGKLVADSADWIPPYDSLLLMNRPVDIQYSLNLPPLSDLLLRPGVAVSMTYDENDGRYARISTALMPSHQLDLAAELSLNPTTTIMNATIHPRSYYHQLTMVELGRNGEEVSGWASMTRESPLAPEGPSNWLSQPMGPSWIAAAGGSARIKKSAQLGVGALWVDEDKRAPTTDEAALHLPPRFMYERAGRLSADWIAIERFVPGISWTHDFKYPGNLLSLDARWNPRWARGWRVELGADFFSAAGQDGFIGQYVGDDRFRVGAHYEL